MMKDDKYPEGGGKRSFGLELYALFRARDLLQEAQASHSTPPKWAGSQESHLQ